MHHPTDRIVHSAAFIEEHQLEQEITQRVHHEGLIQGPITPLEDAQQHNYESSQCV